MSDFLKYGTESFFPLTSPKLDSLHPNIRNIRTDLQHLFLALNGNPQTPLSEVLRLAQIKSVIEFGAGTDLRAADTLSHIDDLELTLADPEYKFRSPTDSDKLKRVTFLPQTTEEIASLVKDGLMKPFDLVISKGLLSPGALVDSQGDIEDWYSKTIKYVKSMVQCLSSNPNALITASSKHGGSVLMLFDKDLEALGLQKIYGATMDQTRNNSGKQYYQRLLKHNLIDPGTPAYEFLALTKKRVQ